MIGPKLLLRATAVLTIDHFAGGGASTGIDQANCWQLAIAVNKDREVRR